MRRFSSVCILGFSLLPAAPALAQQAAPPVPPITAERHYLSLPDGWAEAGRNPIQGGEMAAYVPAGQTAGAWTDMLTIQVFRGMTALPASSFYERALQNYQTSCRDAQAGSLQSGLSNGYQSSFWILSCGQHGGTGAGETAFFRLIQGDDALYLAQRTWRTTAFTAQDGPPIPPEAQQQAVSILSSFGVCNPTDPRHPCPRGQ